MCAGGNLVGDVATLDVGWESGLGWEVKRYSCGAYIGWGRDVESCYLTVCPGMRYTVYAGDGCDNELPVVETSMGVTLTECGQKFAFFGPASCQLLEMTQYCGASAFVCTYTTHIEEMPITDAVSIVWGENNQVGSPLTATITSTVDLFGSGRLRLFLFQSDSLEAIAPCGYMDYYEHDVSSDQFLELVRVDTAELRPGASVTYSSRFTVSQWGGSFVLVLVKSREYLWQVTVLTQSSVLELPAQVAPVQISVTSFDRDSPLKGAWQSDIASKEGDRLVIYRVNRAGDC